MTLNEVMKDTADAIREKTGTTALIAPVDFAEEIKGITAGGGESGGSTFEYLDITNVTGMGGMLKLTLLQMAYMCKVPKTIVIQKSGGVGSVTIMQSVAPASMWASMAGVFDPGSEEHNSAMDAVSAVSINLSDTVYMQGKVLTIGEVFAMYGVQADIDAVPRITKEQFYTFE